ncbi:MAG: DUF2339 domain-containing protein, partial [Gammaproteobacteria bacterium]|nr:DUF2339 domain-containing protein [Gammaproteobacteria bacterium]
MTVIFVIAGIILGALLSDISSNLALAVTGGVIGFVLAYAISLNNRVRELAQQLSTLKASKPTEAALPAPDKSNDQDEVRARTSKPAQTQTVTASSAPPPEKSASASLQPTTPQQTPSPWEAAKPSGQGNNSAPGLDAVIFDKIKDLLFGGNTVVRMGIVVLFFGLSFLIKYAAEHNKLPIEIRLTGVGIVAIVMLILGWRLRHKRDKYAMILQGGSIAVLYLTVFSALRIYQLIPAGAAFFILFALAVFSAALAVLQNSRSLAIFGISGGFLAPILTSTGQGSHEMLFSYYAVLNLGIFAIAWFKAWRPLNIVGFVFTFGIATIWGVLRYTPDFLYSTEPFLILFFLFYVAIAVLFATRQKPELKGYVDGTLVFGTPIAVFGMQYGLIHTIEYGLAFSAVALGLFYISLGTVLIKYGKSMMRDMSESFLAIGIIFGSFAVPLAVEGRVTSTIWALEGAGLIWIGLKQGRLFPRLFGILLQLGSSINFLFSTKYSGDAIPILNSNYLGYFVLAISLLFAANRLYVYRDKLRKGEGGVEFVLFLLGCVWWFAGGVSEIHTMAMNKYELNLYLVFFALSSVFAFILSDVLTWRLPKFVFLILLPISLLIALAQTITFSHPFIHFGYLAWPIVVACFYWMLKKAEAVDFFIEKIKPLQPVMHIAMLWLILFLLIIESNWWIKQAVGTGGIWFKLSWVLIPGAYLLLLNLQRVRQLWPISQFNKIYIFTGAIPLTAFLWIWAIFMILTNPGKPDPLPFLPVLNPMDITLLFVFFVLALWFVSIFKQYRESLVNLPKEHVLKFAGFSLFLWANSVVIRSLHYWADVELKFKVIMSSVLVQSSLSFFWGLLAMVIMIMSSSKRNRPVWFAGAILLGLTIIKLFIIDLKNSSNLQAIGAFIAVGVLAMVIGYFSPLPPKS